jgi:ABC-2 type transport system ATP-binding protein
MTATATVAGPALAVRGVSRRFGERHALRDVSFAIAPGETVGVIGPNGAGKTTLLSIAAGVLAPDAGTVTGGNEGRGRSSDVGWVPQQPAIYGKLTVRENLELFARLERVADVKAVVARMLELTGLRDRADDELGTLSGGNRQRVNIAVGLLADPAVLLLDEPSASLDPRQRERLWSFVTALAQGGTAVLFTTHDVGEAERYADRVLVLADGELLFEGTPAALRAAAEGERHGAGADFESAFVAFLRERGH